MIVVFVSGCQPFVFETSGLASSLSNTSIALPATYWMISDAKLRRVYIPHVVQPGIVVFWYLVVPIYLVNTRKWWGVLYVALHFICTLVASVIAYNLSIALIWPIVFPDIVW